MIRTVFARSTRTVLALGLWCWAASLAEADPLKLLPTPKSVDISGGEMPLSAASRIVATDAKLKPLAAILSDEIWMITNLKLNTADGEPQPGDIVLKINPQLRADQEILAVQNQKVGLTRDFAHTIAIGDTAVVEGWDYRAVCEGTATLLQAIASHGGRFVLPRMKVKDWPHADYTGTMIDVARQYIPIDAVKFVVEACRLWKIRYIQLHLSDDHGFTFPSKAFPKLGSKNAAHAGGVAPKVYDLQELAALVAFADARGVTLVPELETPGHSGAMRRSMPDPFEAPGTLNIASDKMYEALDTLVGEMSEVFASSPYFHIGCDETNYGGVMGLPATKEYLQRHNIPGDTRSISNVWECYVLHAFRMNDLVRKRGKVPIAWEGVADDTRLKDAIIVMTWYPHAVADRYQKQGWTTITVPWDLGLPLPEWNIYFCNGARLARTDKVLGGNRPMWEMSVTSLLGGYAHGLCERQERTWGPDNSFKEDEYRQRMAASRALLDRLALPVKISTEGQVTGIAQMLRGRHGFSGTLTVKLSSDSPRGTAIHYTLDGSEPTTASSVYTEPLKLEKSFQLNAALFQDGRKLGSTTRAIYDKS